MTAPLNAVTMFCDDAREEASNTETLVGVLPDNINVPRLPFVFPKLAVYTRIVVPIDFEAKPIVIKLSFGETEINKTEIPYEVVREALKKSTEAGSPIAGFISRAISNLFQIEGEGRLLVHVQADDLQFVSGTLNIRQMPQNEG